MYCTKCGKEIESGIICDECLAKEREAEFEQVKLDETLWEPAYGVVAIDATVENEDRMLGFGRALASAITGFIGYIAAIVCYMFAIAGDSLTAEDPDMALGLLIGALVCNLIFSLPLGIISLVMGTKSIKLFKRTVGKKPVATLILGIAGVYQGATALLMLLASLGYI